MNGYVVGQQLWTGPSGSNVDLLLQPNDEFEGYYLWWESITNLDEIDPEEFFNRTRNEQLVYFTPNFDRDADGLPDDGEFIIGTSRFDADTDGDGISDSAELEQGLDPLDGVGFTATGLISSLALTGEANEVTVEGSALDAGQQLAYVATGSYGLAVVDVSQFNLPITLGQLDLPGDATDVAVDPGLQFAAVASGAGGLHVVDVSDPMLPALVRTVNVDASRVEVVDGVAYATVGSSLFAVDLISGEVIQSISLGGTLTDVAHEGLYVYTMNTGRVLTVVDIGGFDMLRRGSLQLPDGGGKLFVGNGIAYAAATNSGRGGYSTVNVSDPDTLVLVSGSDVPGATSAPGNAIVSNGSGIGLLAGPPRFFGNTIELLDVSNSSNTYDFITRFNLPGEALGIAIGSGIAFIAAGSGGLQVVNYLPFDNKGVAPAVTISAPNADLDEDIPGIQVIEGTSVPIIADIADDQQVRNVELLVNGEVVRNDVSFPFDFSAIALPAIPGGATTTVQVRATDTGGNATVSESIIFQLVPDTFAPAVSNVSPEDGAKVLRTLRTVRIGFSESLDADSVSQTSFRLLDSVGTTIIPTDIQLRSDDRVVQLTYPELDRGEYQVVIEAGVVADRAGNVLGESTIVSRFTVTEATTSWITPGNGFWDEPNNWRNGVLPGPTDLVLIDVPGDVTITHRSGDTVVVGLISNERFLLSGGTLEILESIRGDGLYTFRGGTVNGDLINEGTVVVEGENVTFAGTFTNTVDGTLRINGGGNNDSATLTISDGFINVTVHRSGNNDGAACFEK